MFEDGTGPLDRTKRLNIFNFYGQFVGNVSGVGQDYDDEECSDSDCEEYQEG